MSTEVLFITLAATLVLTNVVIAVCFFLFWRKSVEDPRRREQIESAKIAEQERQEQLWTRARDRFLEEIEGDRYGQWHGDSGVLRELLSSVPNERRSLETLLLAAQARSVEHLSQIRRALDTIGASEIREADRRVHLFEELLKRFEAAMAESRYREADMLRHALSSFLSQQSNIQREGASQLHSQVQELRQSLNLLVEKQGIAAEDMAAQKEQERISREQGNLNRLQVVLGNQAELLQASGDLVSAMSRLKEQEAICRQLGNVDGLVRALHNQAVIRHAMGNFHAAISLNQEVESIIRHTLKQSEREFGSEHPETLERLSHLAESLERKGEYAAAEMLYRRVLEASERMLGPEHATTRVSRENVARARSQSNKSAAETDPSSKPPDKIIGAMHELRTPEVPTPRIDKVHFSVASPPSVQPGKKFIVDVWAHFERQRAEVERRVQQARPQTDPAPVIRPKGPFKIERGTTLYVRLKFSDLQVEPPEDVILWEGEIGNASFVVAIPSETPEGVICGLVSVHWEGGFQIARVSIQIIVAAKGAPSAPTTQPLHHIRKAFASYASPDRDEVLGRVQGMQKIAPDLDVFLDVVKLRSGEDWEKKLWQVIPESDVFYLFWSAAAKASPWVEKEWRCALNKRGEEFIDPVPLVSPEEVRPPDELSKKHFNDWILAYRRGRPKASD